MKKFLCKVQYSGKNFFGWQIQNAKEKKYRTVENELKIALEKVLKHPVNLFVSGRTDAGVSAKGQYFHFETTSPIDEKGLLFALRSLLPKDISVVSAKQVDSSFDARYSAVAKEYHYMCYFSDFVDVFLEESCVRLNANVDIKQMKKAIKLFKGMKNFSAYHKKTNEHRYNYDLYKEKEKEILNNKNLTKQVKASLLKIARKKHTTQRNILSIKLKQEKNLLTFKIKGDGFLHNMVRIIIGTIVEVGEGKKSLEQVKASFEGKAREFTGKTMPSKALILWEVFY